MGIPRGRVVEIHQTVKLEPLALLQVVKAWLTAIEVQLRAREARLLIRMARVARRAIGMHPQVANPVVDLSGQMMIQILTPNPTQDVIRNDGSLG